MAASRLDDHELHAALQQLSGWTVDDGKLARTFSFADFGAALGFMVRVGLVCERLNHHPNWSNVYRTVEVRLWTHDSGGVTALDIELATAMNALSRPDATACAQSSRG